MRWQKLGFNVPKDWAATQLADGVQITSPGGQGAQCTILVLAPRASTVAPAGRHQELLTLVQALLPGIAIEGEVGPDPMTYRIQGVAGGGWEYAGLNLRVGTGTSKPFIAYFGQTAVPVVPVVPAGASCLSSQKGEADGLEVFHSLTLDGFGSPSPSPLAEKVLGSWFSADRNTGIGLVLGANAQYVDVAIVNGTAPVNSYDVQDVSATWVGDGRYVSVANALAYFPSSSANPARSHYVRVFDEENASSPTGWISRLCQLKRSALSPSEPYEICATFQP